MAKKVQEMLDEANQRVPKIGINDAIELINDENTVFLDVRSNDAVRDSGLVKGAVHAERGLIEFFADREHSLHKPELNPEKKIVLYCGAGGQAALAGSTLLDMGYENVHNMGSFQSWKDAGGEIEDL